MFGTIQEAVQVYGVSKATIERKIASGDLPSFRDGTGRRVWLKPFDSLKITLEMLAEEIASLRSSLQGMTVGLKTVKAVPQEEKASPQEEKASHQPVRVKAEVELDETPPLPFEDLSKREEAKNPKVVGLSKEKAKTNNLWVVDEGVTLNPEYEGYWAAIPRLWKGSVRQFEKEAGLGASFFWNVRQGKKQGSRSRNSWNKIAAVIERLEAEKIEAEERREEAFKCS